MARQFGILAAVVLSLAGTACTSVSVEMAEPKYATRLEDLIPDERASAPAPERRPAADPYARREQDPVVRDRDEAPGAPAFRPEPIRSEELPPLDDARPADRYQDDRYARRDPPPTRFDEPPARTEPRSEPRSYEPRPTQPVSEAGAQYIVQPGDTLSGISRRFGVSPARIIERNGLTPQGALRSGQPLDLPAGAMDDGPDPYAMGPSPRGLRAAPGAGLSQQASRTPAPESEVAPPPPPPPPTRAETAPTRVAETAGDRTRGRGRFIWPVRGEILSPFGSAGTGLRNDGINIGAPEGETVKAAAAGEVVYAGSAVPEFGNLVLIKHADGWVTAYGHLGSIDVKMRDRVTQGQRIGSVGTSGGVPRPQLHFEMRHASSALVKAAPVDPIPVLP